MCVARARPADDKKGGSRGRPIDRQTRWLAGRVPALVLCNSPRASEMLARKWPPLLALGARARKSARAKRWRGPTRSQLGPSVCLRAPLPAKRADLCARSPSLPLPPKAHAIFKLQTRARPHHKHVDNPTCPCLWPKSPRQQMSSGAPLLRLTCARARVPVQLVI